MEQYECEKCHEKIWREELTKHVQEEKHYSFKLMGTELILCFA